MSRAKEGDLVSNRKAFYNYEILETIEAGIILQGTEIKSLREHGGNIQDAYILISSTAVTLKNAGIAPYRFGNVHNHPEKRDRILLLHKNEKRKLKQMTELKGFTLVPLALYLSKGLVKVKIGVAKGKKLHDKRDAVKEREDKRIMARASKNERE